MSATSSTQSISSALGDPIALQITKFEAALGQKPVTNETRALADQLKQCRSDLGILNTVNGMVMGTYVSQHNKQIAKINENLMAGKYFAILDRVLTIGEKIQPSEVHVINTSKQESEKKEDEAREFTEVSTACSINADPKATPPAEKSCILM